MIRWLIAGLLVAGLAIGVWMLWPTDEPSPSSTTIAAIDTTTSTSLADPSTTTTEPVTSTTTAAHVVTTVEEAEAILADLWFGWFEGIYNQDEARIREVVGSQTASWTTPVSHSESWNSLRHRAPTDVSVWIPKS